MTNTLRMKDALELDLELGFRTISNYLLRFRYVDQKNFHRTDMSSTSKPDKNA